MTMLRMLWKTIQAVVTFVVLAVLVVGVVVVYELSTAPVGARSPAPNAMSPETIATVRKMAADSARTSALVDEAEQQAQTNSQLWASTSCIYSFAAMWNGLDAYHATFDPTLNGVKVEAVKLGKAAVLLLAAATMREVVEDRYLNGMPLACTTYLPADAGPVR